MRLWLRPQPPVPESGAGALRAQLALNRAPRDWILNIAERQMELRASL